NFMALLSQVQEIRRGAISAKGKSGR
ncbi:MAG: hypothetical protein K0R89_1281, partial [Ramlibacter sp.]|nr:hypothetical protein [Ramlibacter sp.]